MSANPDDSITLTFQDIKDTAWYARELNAAIVNGIAKGFSTLEFRPEALVNREQAAKMLINVLLSEGVAPAVTVQQFSDESDISVWAFEDVKMAMEQQLVKGYPDNTFRPKQGLTRAEAATLIYRLREHFLQNA
ncbi:S-layer homology domain-containing protein [Paenibacillus sp. PK1-4R]|uniref:S-layer homology domain-containing protein n=1 Tax=Paenibacillus sp. PK1-4R TaxID=3049075 RepID=UPI0025A0109A|nr:S-layer homology domain-containing protein [Paenibacillus sp. PK1-4R]WJM05891.1 S-layer homology domain-containing protein [Paenibacillus sp. PK1-4R]